MKNSMFLMLVLLHITSQPAPRSISHDAMIIFGTIGIGLAGLAVVKAGTRWCTHVKVARCAKMQNGPDKEQAVYDLLSRRSFGDMLSGQHHDQLYAIQMAKKHKFNIDARNNLGVTPVRVMVNTPDPKMVECFIDSGANIHQELLGTPLLDGAISDPRCPPKMVELLIKRGANIHFQDERGQTCLSRAVLRDDSEIIVLLLLYGAQMGERDFEPCWEACYRRSLILTGMCECEFSKNQYKKTQKQSAEREKEKKHRATNKAIDERCKSLSLPVTTDERCLRIDALNLYCSAITDERCLRIAAANLYCSALSDEDCFRRSAQMASNP